jgi:hypothetical protein
MGSRESASLSTRNGVAGIGRREFLGVGALAFSTLLLPRLVRASLGDLSLFIIDTRFQVAAPALLRVPCVETDGDVTEVWVKHLRPLWRAPGGSVAGLTGSDALFVIELLAQDRGRRVAERDESVVNGASLISWVIKPFHPSARA